MNRLGGMLWRLMAISLLVGCAHTPVSKGGGARENAPFLTKQQAMERSSRVSHVTYQLSLSLPADNVPFTGSARIHFNLSDAKRPLTLDFVGGEILSLKVNGKASAIDYNGNFLTLAPELLFAGRQSVEIEYRHSYVRDGQGLHWFRDPEDGATYLFSQFEAWSFNKVFPGFDQPDLKATYRLDVEVPASWTVVSAERENRIENVNADRKRWYFPDTQSFSTYLLSLHAGPYQVWQEPDTFRIPLRLFARKSYAQYVNTKEWFHVTRQGLDYFEQYFFYPFPFSKYDQLLVPEFIYGAMENVGAVTFKESLQPRREQNAQDRRLMAVVVLHEMAHQWFGNLVTMRWWDDIWLNESFAEWMGSMATAKATQYSDAMVDFSANSKSWGYEEDQAVTTHPVVQNIPNTDVVMSVMDGITYAKGASVLMQLQYLLGGDTFERGVAEYFSRYAWQNTSLRDFIGTLGQVANRDLDTWTQNWLMKEGVNALRAEYSCADGRITQLDLEQKPANGSGVLREHRLDLLLMEQSGKRTFLDAHITSEHNPIAEAVGAPCPDFILPNVSDHTFAQVLLDTKSIAFVRNHFRQIENPVERGMVWRSLWESVQAGLMSPVEFIELSELYLADETDVSVLRTHTYYLRNAYAYLEIHDQLLPTQQALAPEHRKQLEALAYERYMATSGGLQQRWFEVWLTYLHSPAHRDYLKSLIRGNKLALDHQWWGVGVLNRVADDESQYWIDQLKIKDQSADAQVNEWVALAQRPDATVKQQWIDAARDPNSTFAYTQMRRVLDYLFPMGQEDLRRQFSEDIVEAIPDLSDRLSSQSVELYTSRLIPRLCDQKAADRLKIMAQDSSLPGGVIKVLKQRAQAEEICVGVMKTLEK